MKKKLVSMLLALVMVLSLVPAMSVTAWAGSLSITIADDETVCDTNEDVLNDGTVSFDLGTKTLTLNNATIDAEDSEFIYYGIKSTYDNLTIVLVGENRIGKAVTYKENETVWGDYSVEEGIYANGNITFTGSGSLTIYDRYAGITAQNVTFGTDTAPFSGTLTVEDYGNAPSCAINAEGTVTINGGTFNLTSYKSNGIYAGGTVTINGGKVMAKSSSEEGKYAISATGGLTIADTMEVVNANETYTSGTTEPLTAKDNGFVTIQPKAKPSSGRSSAPSGHTVLTDLSGITAVYVDGKKVDSKYYSISGGNVTLTQAFLDTLSAGTHSFKAENATHIATGTFTIERSTASSPKTADAGIAMYGVLSVMSLMGMGWVGKKKRDEE